MGLSSAQREQFERDGYLVVEGVFDPDRDLKPVIAEYEGVLDGLAGELHEQGVLAATYRELPFQARLTRVYAESGRAYAQHFDFSLPQRNIKADTPFWAGLAVFALMRHEGLLDAVESVIGPEIYSNPVQHVRLKPPEHLLPKDHQGGGLAGITPWHQDNGVVNEEADETEMLTVWFPLVDVTAEMGCLSVVPGSHRAGLLTHCPGGGGLHVPDQFFSPGDGVPVPMRAGSVLFLTKRTLHCSLPNRSEHVRCSFDLRYQPIGQPTGRSAFPGFVARSRQHPETELHDPKVWTALWLEARRALAVGEQPKFNRWDANAPVCA